MELYNGKLPADYDKLLSLSGIGTYTAGAISSIAYGLPKPAVDGNVLRVITRITENSSDILKQSTKREIEKNLEKIMPVHASGAFNQSLMELGATVCVPNGMAKCECCPVAEFCMARAHDTVLEYPKKAAKKPRKIEEKTILIIQNGQEFAIQKRPQNGLLAGLYELPNRPGYLTQEEAIRCVEDMKLMPVHIKEAGSSKHIFSHVEWHMKGYLVKVASTEEKQMGQLIFIDKRNSKKKYPIPSAFSAYRKYIEEDF